MKWVILVLLAIKFKIIKWWNPYDIEGVTAINNVVMEWS